MTNSNEGLKINDQHTINVKYSFKDTNNTAQNVLEKYLKTLQEDIE